MRTAPPGSCLYSNGLPVTGLSGIGTTATFSRRIGSSPLACAARHPQRLDDPERVDPELEPRLGNVGGIEAGNELPDQYEGHCLLIVGEARGLAPEGDGVGER